MPPLPFQLRRRRGKGLLFRDVAAPPPLLLAVQLLIEPHLHDVEEDAREFGGQLLPVQGFGRAFVEVLERVLLQFGGVVLFGDGEDVENVVFVERADEFLLTGFWGAEDKKENRPANNGYPDRGWTKPLECVGAARKSGTEWLPPPRL